MIWDMATVRAVQYYEAQGDIDLTVLHRGGDDARNALFDKLFRVLSGTINETWPVAIDKADCRAIKASESRALMTETYLMRWQPRDRPGEIMGGPHDGVTTPPPDAIGNYMGPLRMPNYDPSIASMYVRDPITGEHPIITRANRYTEYEVTGWSDLHRRWIYTPREQ